MDLNRLRQLAGITHTRAGLGESVGSVILQQLGGAGRVQAMLGAKNISLSDNGVSFRWPNKERSKGNAVRITLDPSDTYTMEFLNISGSNVKTVKKYTDVYNDQLVDIFEKQTGWYLSLGGGKKAPSGKKPGPEVDPSTVTAKHANTTVSFWTVSSMDGDWPTLDAAKKAWFSAGKPKQRGSTVWATEHQGSKTLRTVTLNPSMEALDELRAMLGERESKKVEDEDCQCEDGDEDCECEGEAQEFSQDQLDAMEAVQGYELPFYARTKTSDGEQWFRATGTLKNGNFSGMMLDAGAAGRSSSKAKKASLDAKWAKQSWDEVDADKVPPKIKSALGEEVEDRGCDVDPMEALLDSVRDIAEAGKGKTYAQAQADIMAGLEKDGWAVKKTGPGGSLKIPHATSPDGEHRLYFKAQAIYLHTDRDKYGKPQHDFGNARSLHLGDIRTGSYDDFGKALGHWTGQTTKGEPVKKAAPAPAGAAKSASAPAVAAPAAHQLSPDQYHQKHGECPDGYHFDDSSKHCVKAKTEERKCVKCGGHLGAQNPGNVCGSCKLLGKAKKVKETVNESLRLAGIDRYPEHVVPSSQSVPRTLTGLVSEIRKYATGAAHSDWTTDSADSEALEDGKGFQCMECGKKFKSVKAAENAQQNGCPKCGGTDIDLAEATKKVPCGKCGGTSYNDIRGRLGDCCLKKEQRLP